MCAGAAASRNRRRSRGARCAGACIEAAALIDGYAVSLALAQRRLRAHRRVFLARAWPHGRRLVARPGAFPGAWANSPCAAIRAALCIDRRTSLLCTSCDALMFRRAQRPAAGTWRRAPQAPLLVACSLRRRRAREVWPASRTGMATAADSATCPYWPRRLPLAARVKRITPFVPSLPPSVKRPAPLRASGSWRPYERTRLAVAKISSHLPPRFVEQQHRLRSRCCPPGDPGPADGDSNV